MYMYVHCLQSIRAPLCFRRIHSRPLALQVKRGNSIFIHVHVVYAIMDSVDYGSCVTVNAYTTPGHKCSSVAIIWDVHVHVHVGPR